MTIQPLKNLRNGCGIFLGIFVALGFLYSAALSLLAGRGYLRAGAANRQTLIALLAAMLMSVAVMLCWAALHALRDIRRLGDSAWRLDFREGDKVFLCGRIYPLNFAPAKSPFAQRDCVVYEYEILGYSGNQPAKECWGVHLVPSVIRTMRGEHRLLSRPHLEGFEKTVLKDSLAQQRAAAYLEATRFETIALDANFKELINNYMKEYEERDSVVQVDMRHSDDSRISAASEMHETCVEVGAEVCLAGLWAGDKATVVADMSKSVLLTLYKGGAREVKARLVRKAASTLLVALVLAAAIHLFIVFILTRNLVS